MIVPLAGELSKVKVLKRRLDRDRKPTDNKNENLILDTHQYEVQFLSVKINTYTANIIAENLYSHIDSEGHESFYLDEILEHHSDEPARSILTTHRYLCR